MRTDFAIRRSAYELKVKPDGFPTIDLLRPTEDLEVNGDEVLTLEYSARDDFGIGEVNSGRQNKRSRRQDSACKKMTPSGWSCATSSNGISANSRLRDGEEAVFYLQVFDNDTISGPKLGTSRSLRLQLKNLKGEHQQVADMIRDLNSRMVDLLADHLETPLPGEKPTAQRKRPKKARTKSRRSAQANRRGDAPHGKRPDVRFRHLDRS